MKWVNKSSGIVAKFVLSQKEKHEIVVSDPADKYLLKVVNKTARLTLCHWYLSMPPENP